MSIELQEEMTMHQILVTNDLNGVAEALTEISKALTEISKATDADWLYSGGAIFLIIATVGMWFKDKQNEKSIHKYNKQMKLDEKKEVIESINDLISNLVLSFEDEGLINKKRTIPIIKNTINIMNKNSSIYNNLSILVELYDLLYSVKEKNNALWSETLDKIDEKLNGEPITSDVTDETT